MQNSIFFAIELMNFRFFSFFSSNFAFFLRIFDEFFSGFRAKFQKRVTSVAFQSNLRKQIRKLPKILKSVKSIQYYSILFIRVLTHKAPMTRACRVLTRSRPYLDRSFGTLATRWGLGGHFSGIQPTQPFLIQFLAKSHESSWKFLQI